MHLSPVKGDNRFCGPAALAAVTGITTDEGAAYLRVVTRRRAIDGVSVKNMIDALVLLGFDPRPTWIVDNGPPLWEWLAQRTSLHRRSPTIVQLVRPNHFVTIYDHLLVDNHSRSGVSVYDSSYLGAYVRAFIRVTDKEDV